MDASWDDIRIFLQVARSEGLSSAGRHLKMDPATVGRRIGRLETSIGAVLFLRSPQGYALTEAGTRFLAHAEEAEEALQAGGDALGGSTEQLSGQIRIGAPDGSANYLLPQVCAAIQADNPGLEIQILAAPRLINLSKREADMAVMVSRPETGRLTVQKIVDYKLHLATADPKLQQIARLEDLKGVPVVGYIQDMIFDSNLDYLAEVGASSVQLSSNSVAVQTMMLRAGGGVGIVHDFVLPFAPELKPILTDQISLTRTFYLVRHASDRRSDRLQRFAALLVDGIRREIVHLTGPA